MEEMIRLYGISNCDSVKKAKKWLDSNRLAYKFVDFRKEGIDLNQIAGWVEKAGLEKVLNKRGTTWRKLSEEQQNLTTEQQIVELIFQQPTLIKRPILEKDSTLLIGFNEDEYLHLKN